MWDYFRNSLNIELIYLMRIAFAAVCGLLVGIERTKRQKEAGIRTHFIVACGASLITCISVSFDDKARIAAQIISGISFLGAGVIFFRRESVHGLTTAAGIWATAGIGMAMGSGLYVLALGATGVLMAAQFIFHSRFYRYKNYQQILSVKFIYSDKTVELLRSYFKVKEFSRFKVGKEKDSFYAEAVIRPQSIYMAAELAHLVVNSDYIVSIERLEDL